MTRTNRIAIRCLIGLGLSVLLAPVAARAEKDGRSDRQAQARFDVDFPGGTIVDYVETIRRARPGGAANIVIMPSARRLAVPPIALVRVTVEAAIQVLEGPYKLDNGRNANVVVFSYNIGDSPDVVMKVAAEIESSQIRSAVWSVQDAMANGQTPDELLGAVEAVMSLFPTKAKISYHPPTRLLIARGTDEQLSLVEEALHELISGAERRHDELSSIRDEMEGLQSELQRMTAEMRVADKELAVTRAALEQTIKAHDNANATAEDVGQAELQVARAEAELQMRQQQRERIEKRLDRLRASAERFRSSPE